MEEEELIAIYATLVSIGAGVEVEHPDARLGGVVEVNVEMMRQVSLQLLGRARRFSSHLDCGQETSGGLYDGAVGIRFDLLQAGDAEHALPFFGFGLGYEASTLRGPESFGDSTLFYFDVGVDLFASASSHSGLRVLFRVDAMDFSRTDAGGALLAFARF